MFNKQNFCHIASNNRNDVKAGVFVYKTTDDLATVSASGYFNDKIIDINLHDLIIHEWHDPADRTKVQRNVLCVTERTLDNVGTAVIKSKWEGDIEQEIIDLANIYVKQDGTSVMSAPLKFKAGSLRGAIGPSFGGVELYTLNNDDTLSLVPLARITTSAFTPHTDNAQDVGSTTRKWKDAYIARVITAALNNGFDIAVPVTNQAETLALKSQVDLAANSGRMITDEGVWYAKMATAGTIPAEAEVEGRNYADFTQVDGSGDPIIVIYTYTSGAWTQTETITPPAEYDGYVPVTSKIWDIQEQTGQQGGRILWNHQSKDFTPYPVIISFEDAALTGTPTAPNLSAGSPNNQIVNKQSMENALDSFDIPAIFEYKWRDATTNNAKWALSDGNWINRADAQTAYQHLVDDYSDAPYLSIETRYDHGGQTDYIMYYRDPSNDTTSPGGALPVLTPIYAWTTDNTSAEYTTLYSDRVDTFPATLYYISASTLYSTINTTPLEWYKYKKETIAGIDINYCQTTDGHKIVLADQESAVSSIFATTGTAWYYILDTANQRIKLPRKKSTQIVRSVLNNDGSWYRLYADGSVEQGGQVAQQSSSGTISIDIPVEMANTDYTLVSGAIVETNGSTDHREGANEYISKSTTSFEKYMWNHWSSFWWKVSGQSAINMDNEQCDQKYLYFYIG